MTIHVAHAVFTSRKVPLILYFKTNDFYSFFSSANTRNGFFFYRAYVTPSSFLLTSRLLIEGVIHYLAFSLGH